MSVCVFVYEYCVYMLCYYEHELTMNYLLNNSHSMLCRDVD